jgi:hypothetical protein
MEVPLGWKNRSYDETRNLYGIIAVSLLGRRRRNGRIVYELVVREIVCEDDNLMTLAQDRVQ